MKWCNLSEFLLLCITALAKISICLFALRIVVTKRLTYFLYAVIVLLVVVNGTTIFVFIFECKPVKYLWDPYVKGNCVPLKKLLPVGYLQGGSIPTSILTKNTTNRSNLASAILTDLICSALPIIILWTVQTSRKRKIAICTLMGMGLL